ncbi:hypothetical protein DICSQDRAFT_132028 [Dichomitus squalens LYAD-421 SS1]|uniref:DUF7918 domain-containing protein n=1 Tax=Dichomitus squalens TaxID=114155 RepID=A0A4V2KA03_9APHY|nr:uncharacterized protein DICSQDRAFT_132028 [Dichomitus squalens LYAD-421 SS1]EJF65826.1 hypothetical protein DICSQDRAFT_132028 [Dichomitus squalens LYAD-421 SS1]TBU65868.1 hypothetical protein BD310DRAFT_912253 [Dichomitus squalens]
MLGRLFPFFQAALLVLQDMPVHAGFFVHIRSEGERLREYGVEKKDANGYTSIISCYIASESGKTFEVYWHEPASKTDMLVKVEMDGQLTDEVAHFEYEGTGVSQGVIEYAQRAVRLYRFEDVKTTDDDSVARPGRVSAKLGTITVSLFLVSRWDESKARGSLKRPRMNPKSVVNPGYIHEKDKKEGRHNVCFGPREAMSSYSTSFQVYNPIGQHKRPIMVFVFNYRPRAILENKGYVPPSAHAIGAGRKRPSTSAVPHASKRPRKHSPEVIVISDSEDSEKSSESSDSSEGEEDTLGPESEEDVQETPVVGRMSEDDTEDIELAVGHEIAFLQAQIAKLQKELAEKSAALKAFL